MSDRVFNRDDVVGAFFVDEIDERRQRCRFAAAGRAGDEHEAFLHETEFLDGVRQAEIFETENL